MKCLEGLQPFLTTPIFLFFPIEVPTPSVPHGSKTMTQPSVYKEVDPKGTAALLDRRRVSASVSEIRDLYSALQELVPGSATSSILHRALPEEPGDSSNPNSPRSRRKSPNGAKESRNLPRTPKNEEESLRVRRLLPVTPQSPPTLRKLKSKAVQAFDINANQTPIIVKDKPNMDRHGSSGEVLLSVQTAQTGKPSPNMGRRRSSGEILLGERANQLKAPKSPLAMARSVSSQDISREVQSQMRPKSPSALRSVTMDRLVSPDMLARRGSEGILHTPNMNKQRKRLSPLKMGRRGSSGDLSSEWMTPPSPLGSSPSEVMEELTESTSYDSPPRRGRLMNKITKLSNSFKRKTQSASPEPARDPSPVTTHENNESMDHCDFADGPVQRKKLNRVESQMDLLLNSLNDLQGSPRQPLRASASDPVRQLDQRRGSLGTEMQELLGALHELSAMAPGSDSDSLGENEPRPRGGYESHDRAPVQRESLDQLEAYFTEKLRDATRAGASKTPSERSSESEAFHSDKEEGEIKQPQSESSSKKTSLEVGTIDSEIDVVDHPTEGFPTDFDVKRAQVLEGREEFANQVNKKLQDWLEKAMTLAQKEKQTENGHFTTSESEEQKCDSLESEESDNSKDKEPRRLKRNLFSKLSFLRRGERSRGKYKHRRSRSMHDVTFTLENERQFQEGQAAVNTTNTESAQSERKTRRPSTMTRSRSLYNVPASRNSHGERKVREAEDLPNTSKDKESNEPFATTGHVAICRSHVEKTSSKDFHVGGKSEKVTPTATEKPKASAAPSYQTLEATNVKRLTPKKRLCRLPTDLPFFYTPEAEKNDKKQEPKQVNNQNPARNRNKIFSKSGVIYKGMEESFYTEVPNEKEKLKRATSSTLPYPKVLVNERSNCFFGDRLETEVTFFYPAPQASSKTLRRFASMDSFLNPKDVKNCEATETTFSCYGNKSLAEDATQNNVWRRVSDEQSPCPSPPDPVWGVEVKI